MADRAYSDISEMKRRKRELVEKGASRDQIRMIETQIAARLKRYNEQLSGGIR